MRTSPLKVSESSGRLATSATGCFQCQLSRSVSGLILGAPPIDVETSGGAPESTAMAEISIGSAASAGVRLAP
jgi:hypothetical protein